MFARFFNAIGLFGTAVKGSSESGWWGPDRGTHTGEADRQAKAGEFSPQSRGGRSARERRLMGKNKITEIRRWTSKSGETRVYIKAGRRQGCLYVDGNPWQKKGSTDGNISDEEWARIKELAHYDGKWHTMDQDGMRRRSQDLSRTDEALAKRQAKSKAALGIFGKGSGVPSEKQIKYAQHLQSTLPRNPFEASNPWARIHGRELLDGLGISWRGMSSSETIGRAQDLWQQSRDWYSKMDVSQMTRAGISKFIDSATSQRSWIALAKLWQQSRGGL